MVFFVIGVPKIQGNASTSVERVNTSLGSNGKLYNMNIDTTRLAKVIQVQTRKFR